MAASFQFAMSAHGKLKTCRHGIEKSCDGSVDQNWISDIFKKVSYFFEIMLVLSRRPLYNPRGERGIPADWIFVSAVGYSFVWKANVLLVQSPVIGERRPPFLRKGIGRKKLSLVSSRLVAGAVRRPVEA